MHGELIEKSRQQLSLCYEKTAGHQLALLARRGLRRLLRWRAPRCGARLHLCSLGRRCFCPSPCSLVAGCAGSYAGARHGVVRGCTCAVSGGGGALCSGGALSNNHIQTSTAKLST
jgi:hypothetical protein